MKNEKSVSFQGLVLLTLLEKKGIFFFVNVRHTCCCLCSSSSISLNKVVYSYSWSQEAIGWRSVNSAMRKRAKQATVNWILMWTLVVHHGIENHFSCNLLLPAICVVSCLWRGKFFFKHVNGVMLHPCWNIWRYVIAISFVTLRHLVIAKTGKTSKMGGRVDAPRLLVILKYFKPWPLSCHKGVRMERGFGLRRGLSPS